MDGTPKSRVRRTASETDNLASTFVPQRHLSILVISNISIHLLHPNASLLSSIPSPCKEGGGELTVTRVTVNNVLSSPLIVYIYVNIKIYIVQFSASPYLFTLIFPPVSTHHMGYDLSFSQPTRSKISQLGCGRVSEYQLKTKINGRGP